MNPADIAALTVLAASSLFGLARGFVREALDLAALLGAIAGTFELWPVLAPPLRAFALRIDLAASAGDIAAGVLGFLLLVVAFGAVAGTVARLVRASPFGAFDRLLGLGFGALRGAAFLVAAYVLAGLVVPPDAWPGPVRRAAAVPLAYDGARWAVRLVPPDERPHVAPPPTIPDAPRRQNV